MILKSQYLNYLLTVTFVVHLQAELQFVLPQNDLVVYLEPLKHTNKKETVIIQALLMIPHLSGVLIITQSEYSRHTTIIMLYTSTALMANEQLQCNSTTLVGSCCSFHWLILANPC